MQWERKVGTYLTQISISQSTHLANSSDRPKRRGGEMSSGKSEGRVCMPLRYLYPSQFFLDYWFPIGQTKARKRKPERGYALHSDSGISVKSCDIFFWSIPRKWKEKRWAVKETWKGGGCMLFRYLLQSIPVIIGSDRPNRREKERWAVEEKSWTGVRTSLWIHSSVDSYHQFFRSVGQMSGEKDAPKRLRYQYLSQFIQPILPISPTERCNKEISGGK